MSKSLRVQVELHDRCEFIKVTRRGHVPVGQPGVLPPRVGAPVPERRARGLRLGREVPETWDVFFSRRNHRNFV